MKKILVIDDDFGTRKSVQDMLAGAVAEVLLTPDAVSALLSLKDHPEVEGVISDYRLPGLGGYEWIDLLKHYNPKLNMVVISAYGVIKDKVEEKQLKLLIKPFTKDQLHAALGLKRG